MLNDLQLICCIEYWQYL